jgi:hypothetical protein
MKSQEEISKNAADVKQPQQQLPPGRFLNAPARLLVFDEE